MKKLYQERGYIPTDEITNGENENATKTSKPEDQSNTNETPTNDFDPNVTGLGSIHKEKTE